MMEKSLKYLIDIKIAIEFIQEFVLEIESFEDYCNDHKTQSAVERQLVIIGEALNQIKKIDNSIVISSDQQIVSFRNRLVHAYDSIDNTIVWAIIKRHLEPLKEEIQTIINQPQ